MEIAEEYVKEKNPADDATGDLGMSVTLTAMIGIWVSVSARPAIALTSSFHSCILLVCFSVDLNLKDSSWKIGHPNIFGRQMHVGMSACNWW